MSGEIKGDVIVYRYRLEINRKHLSELVWDTQIFWIECEMPLYERNLQKKLVKRLQQKGFYVFTGKGVTSVCTPVSLLDGDIEDKLIKL